MTSFNLENVCAHKFSSLTETDLSIENGEYTLIEEEIRVIVIISFFFAASTCSVFQVCFSRKTFVEFADFFLMDSTLRLSWRFTGWEPCFRQDRTYLWYCLARALMGPSYFRSLLKYRFQYSDTQYVTNLFWNVRFEKHKLFGTVSLSLCCTWLFSWVLLAKCLVTYTCYF